MAGEGRCRMGDDVHSSFEEGCLFVRYAGEFSEENARAVVDAMVDACRRHGCRRMLLDVTEMTGPMPQMSRFVIAEYGAVKILPYMAIALLGREDQAPPDDLFEVAARNRGVNVRVFTDRDAARCWLDCQPSFPPKDSGGRPPCEGDSGETG